MRATLVLKKKNKWELQHNLNPCYNMTDDWDKSKLFGSAKQWSSFIPWGIT